MLFDLLSTECVTILGVSMHIGAIHTSELDRSEIDLSPKRSECERSKTEIDPRSI